MNLRPIQVGSISTILTRLHLLEVDSLLLMTIGLTSAEVVIPVLILIPHLDFWWASSFSSSFLSFLFNYCVLIHREQMYLF